jgi:PhnB protein
LDDKIMHSCLRIGETDVMASDGMGTGKPEFKGISLSLSAANEADADRLLNALSDGGQIWMLIGKTFSRRASADRFGVPWMVVVKP